MGDHETIYLEPEPPSDDEAGRMWCQNDVWTDRGTKYTRADIAEARERAAADGARRSTAQAAANIVTEHYQSLCTEHQLLLVNRSTAILERLLPTPPQPDPVAAVREANDIPIGLLLRTLAHFGDREDPLVHDIRTFLEMSGIPIRKDKIN